MRKNRGITLVSVVITINVLMVIAGVSINTLLGEKGLLTIAKQAKENTELAQTKEETELNELYKQMETELGTSEGISYDAIAKLAEFKRVIADAITSRGIATSKTDTAETMAANIKQLELNTTKPTGIKTDTYISNIRETTTTYSEVTSMTGFTRTTDPDNKISEYLSYSDTDGYRVLKSGWYYIDLRAQVSTYSSAGDLYLSYYINNINIGTIEAWSRGDFADIEYNSITIFLEEGDILYFSAKANGAVNSDYRCAKAVCYPMF